MSLTLDLSTALADAVAAAGQRVVRVEARRRVPASGILWDADTVVTAHHVLPPQMAPRVGLPGGAIVDATLVGRDPTTDVAVLRLASAAPPPAALADSAPEPRVGALALAVARPGRGIRSALGLVSAYGGPWRTRTGGEIDAYLEADVTLYPGYSGGLLIAADGHPWAMLTSALGRDTSVSIPWATLDRVRGSLLAHGRVRRGYLGVGVQAVTLPAAQASALDQSTGLLVLSVTEESAADAAGLHLGDVLVDLDGERLRHVDDLYSALREERLDRPVALRYLRGGEVHAAEVRLLERDEDAEG